MRVSSMRVVSWVLRWDVWAWDFMEEDCRWVGLQAMSCFTMERVTVKKPREL
jgi:hypothetical protein